MDIREIDFQDRVAASAPGIIALTGGGGKTSLLFALGKALAGTGKKVLCTTTTRMLVPCETEWLDVCLVDAPRGLRVAPPRALYAARTGETPGKVRGFEPAEIDRFQKAGGADWILVEADGAAGRPLKAPEAHEPVIPGHTAIAIAVLGLGCFGKPFSPETAFRMERLAEITGLRPGDNISPAAVAPLVRHPDGMFKNVPEGAKRYLFCNQADCPGGETVGREVAAAVGDGAIDGVVIASLRTRGLRCLYQPTA